MSKVFRSRSLIVITVLLAFAFASIWTTSSATQSPSAKGRTAAATARRKPAMLQHRAEPLSYRSPGARHKLVISADDQPLATQLIASGAARRIRQLGAQILLEVEESALAALSPQALARATLRDDWNLIRLKRGQLDTTAPAPAIGDDLRHDEPSAPSLRLVQFFGAPTPDAVAALKATGAKLISYVPNHAYLIWTTPQQLRRVRTLTSAANFVQWEGAFHPLYKIDSQINVQSVEQIPVSIEVVDHDQTAAAIEQIRALSQRILMPEFRVAGTMQIKALIESFNIPDLARLSEVIAIERWNAPELHDERANQIVAGTLTQETINNVLVSRPTRPGYLAFLQSLGFTADLDVAVDITDTGFDLGTPEAHRIHRDFLDNAGQSRINYLNDFTQDPAPIPAYDPNGHGTINASIVGGSPQQLTSRTDAQGFQYGLGIAPMVRLGATKVFDTNGGFQTIASYADLTSFAYRGGARVSNNSWGICNLLFGFCNIYSEDSRAYDALVRDADPAAFGNQEMTIVFSSGNRGNTDAQSVGMPGTAKNVITVGASESFRSAGDNGEPLTDGCGAGPTLADNASDVVSFSSGGPTQEGRAKPDLVAPGTHIVGAATQQPTYATTPIALIGTCDHYFPTGQTAYTWSSGTSHAAPLVAGAAALSYQWLHTRLGIEPSAALNKAFLLNSTSYLSGRFANDDLPGARQGWGLLNLARMFETVDRILYDQSPARTFTESGGEPFEITGVITDSTKEFRVMLVYSDAPAAAFTNASMVNQLNLEVTVGGVRYQGNHFAGQYSTPDGQADYLNNVQGVRLPAGITGPFVIRVRPTIIAGDGVPNNATLLDQDFALVVTNGREAAVPILSVAERDGLSEPISIRHADNVTDASLIPGETAFITVTVANQARAADTAGGMVSLGFAGGASAFSTIPAINALSAATNNTPFQLAVPSNLRCGSVVTLQLRISTEQGQITLPVRLRVGRETIEGRQTLINDDVDSRRVKWKFKKGFALATGVGTSGISSYHAVDPGREDDNAQLSSMLLKKQVTIPASAGNVRLTFFHIFNFEPGFDGGVLEVSTDNGASWQDLGSRILFGGYDGQVTDITDNPLGNRRTWTARGQAGVFSQVIVNLDDFAGERIRLRFLAGFDAETGVREGFTGWFIDDIRLTYSAFACR